jgi:hypothetical protein
MFEKANPLTEFRSAVQGPQQPEAKGRPLRSLPPLQLDRVDARSARRAGEALRALEWGEITARLNAARDLRLLMRHEARPPIEAVAASFGDAAASYFALLDHGEPDVNLDALGQSKALGAREGDGEANRSAGTPDGVVSVNRGDAREMQ